MEASEFAERRNRLLDKIEDHSLVLLFSGVAKKASADEPYPFEVNRNFYYLTGIDQEDTILMMSKSDGERREYLFISPDDKAKEKWYGKRISPIQAYQTSGVRNVLINTALPARLDAALNPNEYSLGPIERVYLDMEKEQKIAEDTDIDDQKQSLSTIYPQLAFADAYPLIVKQRLVKSEAEIEELRAAIATTKLGIQAVMAEARQGIPEYELADTFLKTVNDDDGFQGLAFHTIMAGGPNTCVLHYPLPKATVGKGSLILMDLGARHGYYCADVSRTIPASGLFTPEQKKIYSIVLGCNKAVAKFAHPGITLRELNDFAKEYLASECLSQGLIEKKEDISDVYFHGVSHHIGLDVHDPGGDRDEKLVPGNVISDEPGLYFADKEIGVRIEDDLLITEEGAEVLTKDIVKEVSDIEKFYQIR